MKNKRGAVEDRTRPAAPTQQAKYSRWNCRSKWAGCGSSGRMKGSGPTQKPCGDELLNPQHHSTERAWVFGIGPPWGSPWQQGHCQAAMSAQLCGQVEHRTHGETLPELVLINLEKKHEEAFSATCSLQLPWEVHKRTVRISLQLHIKSTWDLRWIKGRPVLLIIFSVEGFCVILQISRNCCRIRENAE